MRRALLAILSVLFGLAVALPAAAQTIEVLPNTLLRSTGKRDIGQKPEWVSYADCIANDTFTITVNLLNFSTFDLEVWASTGDDCSLKDEREGTAASCWKLTELDPSDGGTGTLTVQFDSLDVAGKKYGQEPGNSTVDVCEETTDNQQISIWFLLVDSGGNAQGQATWSSGIDLIGPAPPTGLSAGIGEDRLIIEWDDSSTAEDRNGYRAYCDPPPAGSSAANAPMGAGALDAGGDAQADASGGAAGAAGAAGSSGSAGTGGGTGNPECPSSLVSGERPDPAYQCGSVTGLLAGSVDAEGLTNGTSYAVAVAAVDLVGNSGVLSEVVCGTPQPVDDFFELYRRAGGKGGGGFCQITAEPATGFVAVLATALLALGIRRRRRS